jgi:transcriptional regulator, XRE family protein
LKQKRKDKNLTQWELAKQLNMPLSFVGKYEQGERRLDVIELMDIAEALDFDPTEVFVELKKINN